MKKIFSFALGALMSLNAWSFENVPATFTWTVGSEAEATVVSDAVAGIAQTKVSVGAGLTVSGPKSNYDANKGNAMMQYLPATSNAGNVPEVMIEYSVKMKKGVTFTLTGFSYDALKDGTDNASYSWSYSIDGVESDITTVSKDELIRNNNVTGTPALNHSHSVTATAGREVGIRLYVSGFGNTKKFALSNIQINGTINGQEEARAFTNFKLDFRSNPYTVVEPAGNALPANVSIAGESYHGNQHGLQAGTITVNVDGPVKFTLGGCGYGNNIAVQKNGEALTTIDNKVGCDNSGVEGGYTKFVTWTYNVEEAATLTFTVNGFLPYFFAEACEFVPQVEVRYFDTDGKTLIGEPQVVEGGSALKYAYSAENVTVAGGQAFRGWFNSAAPTATKVAEDTPLTENMNLYAKASEYEIAEVGKVFTYDLTKNYFYQEDHELFSSEGGQYHDAQHGWLFGNGHTLSIEVAGNALLSVGVCKYSNTGTTEVKDAAGKVVGQLEVEKNVTTDGSEQTIRYTGEATVLTFYFTTSTYIHSIKVYNVEAFPVKNASGYFKIAPNDAAGLLLALATAESGDKIFLPNGTYDLGETVLTPISKDNISIIGQSMDATIIKNAPDFHNEGISTTATFLITANNTYLQDLTIQNALDYFGAINAGLGGGRAVCIQDKGSQTICKNVKLLSNQDTYYSNKVGAVKYFKDCEIHGTVDFICGDGSVYFYGTELVCEQRNPGGGGADAVTASNADANDKGYVFDFCTVKYAEDIQGTLPIVSLGRAWNNSPQTIFLNTFLDDSNGKLNMYKEASAQKDKIARWTLGAMNALPAKFGEYNSVNSQGEVVSPESNDVTFVLNSNEKQMETILSASEAATYTMAYTLGNWADVAKRDAEQAVCDLQNIDPNGIYLVVENPEAPVAVILTGAALQKEALPKGALVRKANGRGGFGEEVENDGGETGIEQISRPSSNRKFIKDGQLFIIRDGKTYTAQGMSIRE